MSNDVYAVNGFYWALDSLCRYHAGNNDVITTIRALDEVRETLLKDAEYKTNNEVK